MKARNLHLNLLHASERQSSSPVRLRVMLPILAALACVGCLVWWGVLLGQLKYVALQTATIKNEIAAKEASGSLRQVDVIREAQAEADQLAMYANGRRMYGNLLRRVADVMPADVQLMELEIPEPPPQNLLPPGVKPGPKVKPVKPLPGPTGTVETVTLRVLGRAPNEKPVESFMKALEGPAFTNAIVIAKGVPPDQMSPRIRSFNQETRPSEEERQLVFDVEYRCRERRFEK